MSEQNGSPHHANDRLRCADDGEPWPCAAWLLARNKADRSGNRQTLIEVLPLRSKRVLRWHDVGKRR